MTLTSASQTIAYFSMEICLEQAIPTYSGGLGVLAGDTLRSAADLGVPMVAVTLVHQGRTVKVRAWRYRVRGVTGHEVPVFLLDTDLPENSEADRGITNKL